MSFEHPKAPTFELYEKYGWFGAELILWWRSLRKVLW